MLLEVLAFFVQNPVNEVLVASSACEVLLKCSATNQLYLLFRALERLETIENTRLRCVKRCAATCSSLQDVLQYVLRDMLQDVLQLVAYEMCYKKMSQNPWFVVNLVCSIPLLVQVDLVFFRI